MWVTICSIFKRGTKFEDPHELACEVGTQGVDKLGVAYPFPSWAGLDLG